MPPPPPPSNPPHPPPTPNAFLNVVLNNPAPSRTYEANNEQAFITATQRSLQARGKDFTTCNEKTDSNAYAERQRRDEAASILESEEVVMWVAAARGESIPQTRAHYRNIVLGLHDFDDANVRWQEEWEVPSGLRTSAAAGEVGGGVASPARSGKGKEKEREIAGMRRKRVSSGQAQG